MSGFVMQFSRDWPRKEIISTPFGPFMLGAPAGYCPWGEMRCCEGCCRDDWGCHLPVVKSEGVDGPSGLALRLLGRGPHGFYAEGQGDHAAD